MPQQVKQNRLKNRRNHGAFGPDHVNVIIQKSATAA